jgi:hypothetical protein
LPFYFIIFIIADATPRYALFLYMRKRERKKERKRERRERGDMRRESDL